MEAAGVLEIFSFFAGGGLGSSGALGSLGCFLGVSSFGSLGRSGSVAPGSSWALTRASMVSLVILIEEVQKRSDYIHP